MITHEYLQTLSRYNQWQNNEILKTADTLCDNQRRECHGIFWGSIMGTLSHIYWADKIWLSRFDIIEAPEVGIKESSTYLDDWDILKSKRKTLDQQLIDWCDKFDEGIIKDNLKFFSGVLQKTIEIPISTVFTHFFNHQTHHRGQVNALLSSHSKYNADTDLFLMPENLWP